MAQNTQLIWIGWVLSGEVFFQVVIRHDCLWIVFLWWCFTTIKFTPQYLPARGSVLQYCTVRESIPQCLPARGSVLQYCTVRESIPRYLPARGFVLQYCTVRESIPQYLPARGSVLQYCTVRESMPQCLPARGSVLQYCTVRESIPQYLPARGSVLQYCTVRESIPQYLPARGSVLQYCTVRESIPQCLPVRGSVLQYCTVRESIPQCLPVRGSVSQCFTVPTRRFFPTMLYCMPEFLCVQVRTMYVSLKIRVMASICIINFSNIPETFWPVLAWKLPWLIKLPVVLIIIIWKREGWWPVYDFVSWSISIQNISLLLLLVK